MGSINLAEFVNNPFTSEATFDIKSFKYTVQEAVRAMNEVLDEGLELHPLEEQRIAVRDWRQIGIGIFGLADCLIKLGLRYGSEESIKFVESISYLMANKAIETSARLAKEFGAFPKCNIHDIITTPFFLSNTDEDTRDLVLTYGLRNSQLLTCAPTGSLSTMLGVSGGIEPIFANSYQRKTESLHNKDTYYKVYTKIVEEYMKRFGIENEENLPDFFVTANTLNYRERVDMQAAWQRHIDASISSTVNLPNEATVEDIEDLYMYAWEKHLKGITIYRDGCSRTGILTTKSTANTNEIPSEMPRGYILDVSDDLIGYKRKLNTGCGSIHMEVYFDELSGEPQETFINIGSSGGCERNYQFISRLMSLALRAGVPIEAIIDQANSIRPCTAYINRTKTKGDTSMGTSCPSAIGYALKGLQEKINNRCFCTEAEEVKTEENISTSLSSLCPECGAKLQYEGGCVICKGDDTHAGCGWSKCD